MLVHLYVLSFIMVTLPLARSVASAGDSAARAWCSAQSRNECVFGGNIVARP